MGWSFSCNRSFGKAELVAKLRAGGYLSQGYEMLESTVRGNNFWFLMRNPDGRVTIGLTLMKSGGKDYGWGEKGLSEEMGPTALDCPLGYLDKASSPEGYAIEWREKIRAYHAAKQNRPKATAGAVVRFGEHDYKLIEPAGERKGWRVVRVSDGAPFRMPASHLSRATFLQA